MLPLPLLLLYLPSSLATVLQHMELPQSEYPGGVCNDGTRAGYFHDTDVSKQGNKVHVYLNGGNLCDSTETCLDRCDKDHDGEVDNHLCTADSRTTVTKDKGLFSSDPANPLHDYWHVDIPYCSSDTWAGTRDPDEQTGGFAFHGKQIFRNVMNHLSHHFNLFQAKSFVLSGSSAGAFGVGLNCDDVADWLHSHNPQMDVKCIADAPDYIPPEVHTLECRRRQGEYQTELREFWGREEDKTCWDWASDPANGISDPALHCGILTTSLQHIQTPIFILVALLDSAISRDYGCFSPDGDVGDQVLVEEWREAMYSNILQASESHPGGKLGFFAPNCHIHGIGGGHSEDIVVPDIHNPNVTLNAYQAISNWLSDSGPYVLLDHPSHNNPTCP